jgi:hypothetical protein
MNSSPVIALVSHDAGGAELLASYVGQNKLACRMVLEGPAAAVFKRRLGISESHGLTEGLSSCDWCLCGTSWQSDLEWRAIAQARQAGKRVVSFLDHWVNYPERFVRNGIQHLPDEIWVADQDAQELAAKHFPDAAMRLVPNPYLIDMKRELAAMETIPRPADERGPTVLFVSENISEHARLRHGDERHWGYTEFDALDYFFENLDVLGEQIGAVVIRPHPSDPPGKYDRVVAAHSGIARLSDGQPLLKEIAGSDIVAGCQSMAMVVGLMAKKRVVSCLPPSGPECCLPQKAIIHMRNLVA